MLFDDTRADWAARDPRGLTPVSPGNRTGFMVHYDGGDLVTVDSHTDCLARVRHDQDFHMDGRGWADIGYNGLVCQHGRAIEGRGADYSGAHCPDFNTSAYGMQFMVGGAQVPTPAAFARMVRLYAACVARSGHKLRQLGHKDGFATECPGPTIYRWVHSGMPAPTEEDDMPTADEVALAVWGYKNASVNGTSDAYKLLTTTAKAAAPAAPTLTPADIAAIATKVADLIYARMKS